MLIENPIAVFENIGVEIRYLDEKRKVRKLNFHSRITCSESAMNLVARKLLDTIMSPKDRATYETEGYPIITEKNVHQVEKLAKEHNTKWWRLANFLFALKNFEFQEYKHRSNQTTLILIVHIPEGMIKLELAKRRYQRRKVSQALRDIYAHVEKYGNEES